MIGRAHILSTEVGVAARTKTPTFLTDNQRVWELLFSITRERECWIYVKVAQRARDGRAAFLALKNHYLGPNNVNILASGAERKLKTTTYNGKKKRWNFERYVQMHVEQHTILEGLVSHGYPGIDTSSKVRYLLDGIRTTKLDSVKTQVLSSPTLQMNFDIK